MSSRRAWCQSRLNSSCSRASSSVRLNISLRRWTPRTVCTARLGRPLSTQYMGAKRSSSIRGSASFRKTSAQLLSRRLAFFGVTRNWDCQRLSCGSRIRNILPSLGQAQRPRPFITLSPPCPRLARGFYEQIKVADFEVGLVLALSVAFCINSRRPRGNRILDTLARVHRWTARGQRKGGEGVTGAMIRARIRVDGRLAGDLQALLGHRRRPTEAVVSEMAG